MDVLCMSIEYIFEEINYSTYEYTYQLYLIICPMTYKIPARTDIVVSGYLFN